MRAFNKSLSETTSSSFPRKLLPNKRERIKLTRKIYNPHPSVNGSTEGKSIHFQLPSAFGWAP